MLTAPELVAHAAQAQLVTSRDVLIGAVTISDESRSNHVQVISVHDQPIVYVKQRGAASLLDGDDAIGHERAALTSLADLGLVPQMIMVADQRTLWTTALAGTALTRRQGPVTDLVAVCAAWGVALATLHQWPTTAVPSLLAPRPWALQLDTLPPSMAGAETAELRAVLRARDEPELRQAAETADRDWTHDRWIHGDLSAANVLVRDHDHQPQLTFIDFEAAGLGEPGWDVATVIDSLEWMAPVWQAPSEPLVEHFLTGYRTAGGSGRATSALQAMRALMTAWQLAARSLQEPTPGLGDDVAALLDRARRFAAEDRRMHCQAVA
ncbi:hypothetical protein GCM10009841_14550 [Microlunatus panaciterrae]|uniref:Aminoglycoside phosphotransferase n=1 Tax=Microlunatus panaciterrae TaxID=400768 RepID=A0ABS2RLY7_9ACTN|nr:aminoglycoside phosphotransferase family protein [Microlunatus panaciterrae]MBM7800015.1 aminoglycoside phosphotransferase [Microlunatus panaciterrae]